MSRLRSLLHELADAVADHLEQHADGARYYDQDTSPFAPAAHCKLVRSGKVPGFKRAGRVFVEREAMHRYIESAPVEQSLPLEAINESDSIEAALERAGIRKAG